MIAGRGGVTPDVLAALLRKYRLLARWRRAKDLSVRPSADTAVASVDPVEVASPAAMRALAREFPGALRELDLLGAAELERRAACLQVVLEQDGPACEAEGERWIAWIAAYHALMQLALALRSPSPPAGPPPAIADDAFLRDVQRPPGGRLSAAVLQALARLFQRPADELRTVLFPPRR